MALESSSQDLECHMLLHLDLLKFALSDPRRGPAGCLYTDIA
jgi:hypothetical protein